MHIPSLIWFVQCYLYHPIEWECARQWSVSQVSLFVENFDFNMKLSRCHLHPDQDAFHCSDLHLLFKRRYCDELSKKETYGWKFGLCLNDHLRLIPSEWLLSSVVCRDTSLNITCAVYFVKCDIGCSLMLTAGLMSHSHACVSFPLRTPSFTQWWHWKSKFMLLFYSL